MIWLVAAAILLIGAGVFAWLQDDDGPEPRRSSGEVKGEMKLQEPEEPLEPQPINREFEGLTTFRGNATRTYYGAGPVPEQPQILWEYPESGGLCSASTDQSGARVWCGTGWTGQPNVVELPNGRVQVRFGAYDRAVHILDGTTGRQLLSPFITGDLIKGTVTSDPDGFPLLYTGSRDNFFRVLALDRGREPVELWSLSSDSAPTPVWNNDWDGSALVIDDYLVEGGENSWFYVVKLNRAYDRRGRVTVAPKVTAMVPGFDDQLFTDVGDDNVSIEGSVAFNDGVVYFANSGGLVQGWNISKVLAGGTKVRRVFRFWTGDDTDASIVIDDEGFLYVASELERLNPRALELGQLMKLDPRRKRNPVVWSVPVPGDGGAGGMWATPAIFENALFAPTNSGRLLGVNRSNGRIAWELELPGPLWSSPAVVDETLIVGDCSGVLHAYDVSRPLRAPPPEQWSLALPGCIESTPAVWEGMIYVGTRGGRMYGIGDPR
jgi:outer membrane protein assembly factor BamB